MPCFVAYRWVVQLGHVPFGLFTIFRMKMYSCSLCHTLFFRPPGVACRNFCRALFSNLEVRNGRRRTHIGPYAEAVARVVVSRPSLRFLQLSSCRRVISFLSYLCECTTCSLVDDFR